MRWSNSAPLSSFQNAPSERGVYQIGFGTAAFDAKYLGRALGSSSSIKARLRAHYNMSGSKHITDANKDGLRVKWITASHPDFMKAKSLKKEDFPWNEKSEPHDSE